MICIVCQSSSIIPSEARQCPVVCLTIPEKEKVMDECKRFERNEQIKQKSEILLAASPDFVYILVCLHLACLPVYIY